MIVAIDGPAGAGKSTVARAVARRLGCAYLDTGAMYRALTWLARRRGVAPDDAEGLAELAGREPIVIEPLEDGDRVRIGGRDVTRAIRDPDIAADVSRVSSHPAVRERMVAAQRALLGEGSWVCDGRDVGTVVWPEAEVKVFLTASLAERARRRRAELAARGIERDEAWMIEDVRRRDERDSTREASPLRAAPDAVVIDSSGLDPGEVAERVARLAEEALASRGRAAR